MMLDGVHFSDLPQPSSRPYLTQMNADHGADVLKIEPSTGESVGNVGYRSDDEVSVWFDDTHLGKRTGALNLKDPTYTDAVLALADEPGTLNPYLPPFETLCGAGS